jgi:hypothetical protein
MNRISGIMVSVLTSSAVDWLAQNQDNVSELGYMSIRVLLFQ